MSILDTLITDRVKNKGHYNITDLNRVGEAMKYVAARLRACGYDVQVSPRTDWIWTTQATLAEAQRYLRNLRKLREALLLFDTTPPLPSEERPFNAQEANDIEKILLDVEAVVKLTMASWYYGGDLYAGEV